ncbi:MAG: N-acetylmuramoyl-L-alanine amidase [Clostridiales bacterium]|nr:N-acetylmuramoyl-L-alanine amidase [Clostridiales bacterium]
MKKFLNLFFIFSIFMVTCSWASAASYIKNIQSSNVSGQTVIKIELSEPAKFTEGRLVFNNKIYLDFQNTIIREKINVKVNNNKVQAVRAAQNMTKPTYVSRVVFDMDAMIDYNLNVSENGKLVVVTFGEKIVEKQEVKNEIVEEKKEAVDTTSRGNVNREENKKVQEKKLIVIDAGHGGKDPGAVFSSVYEKSLNLDIAKRLKKLLTAKGYEVIMTRTTDKFVELADRAELANQKGADLFISIHNNSMPSGYSGVMTLYSTRDIDEEFSSKDLANAIQTRMVKTLGTKDIGARERDNLVVLNKTTMPAVIVEVGCMSDSKELKELKKATFRQKAAKGIYEAIVLLDK